MTTSRGHDLHSAQKSWPRLGRKLRKLPGLFCNIGLRVSSVVALLQAEPETEMGVGRRALQDKEQGFKGETLEIQGGDQGASRINQQDKRRSILGFHLLSLYLFLCY